MSTPQGRRTIQVRITVDEEMGGIFTWVEKLPQTVRAREMLQAVRSTYDLRCAALASGTRSSAEMTEPVAERSAGMQPEAVAATPLTRRKVSAALALSTPPE